MAYLLGIDTGGTYTDAVVLDDVEDSIVAKAKSLTTHTNLAIGIGAAIDAVLGKSAIQPNEIAMVSLSTTLATNALVEGQGGRVGLIFIGFDKSELVRTDLAEAMGDDPIISVSGGHTHSGAEMMELDVSSFIGELETLKGVSGVAIAGKFATRNPDHELRIRDLIREHLSVPTTCSHELSQALGGPKRALTAVLNARLIGLIDGLILATEKHLKECGIFARLMVVRGDGALISAEIARERPIDTILSGPAASVAGAQWLTGEQTALVSDIGGTTTDVCVLRDGFPKIDAEGAKVGRYRTMVEAVAMRTFGLGGDSEVSINSGLGGGVTLGPRRLMPVSFLADRFPEIVHGALDKALTFETPPEEATRFVLAQWETLPEGLDPRETLIAARLEQGPLPLSAAVTSRVEMPALSRLIQRGLVLLAGVTPSDASFVLDRLQEWDKGAAVKALTLMAKRKTASGNRLSDGPRSLALMIIDQLTQQSIWAMLETCFSEEGWDNPAECAQHPLMTAALAGHSEFIRVEASIAKPLIGLGASAQNYYRAVGDRLKCETILPEHGDVANAIGAVVGLVSVHADGTITSAGEGSYRVHFSDGRRDFNDSDKAINFLRDVLTKQATEKAQNVGVDDTRVNERLDIQEAKVEARVLFVEATMRITARGRPRITS